MRFLKPDGRERCPNKQMDRERPTTMEDNIMRYEKNAVTEKLFHTKKETAMTECTDLFEILKNLVCCTYISDLRTAPYNAKARMLLSCMDLARYSAGHINDVRKYIGAAL